MDAFDYDLPDGSIAQEPIEPRDAARLLVATDPAGEVRHLHVRDLPDLLGPGDALVVNDSRVMPARLRLRKPSGGQVEVLLLEPVEAEAGCWEALVRPGRRVSPGTRLGSGGAELVEVGERREDGTRLVRLLRDLTGLGAIALPPYIRQPLRDPERYQTVYAARPGSVAAPTAGLHLTHDLLRRCRERGVQLCCVELAVGLGTFRPVVADEPVDHVVHSERYRVPAPTMEACRRARRVVAVGTTTVRALESAAATGELAGRSSLFIRGEFPFRVVDTLVTNFHQPRSSLLLLLHAFCGDRWRSLYELALAHRYRFLSFGDAMLVSRRAS